MKRFVATATIPLCVFLLAVGSGCGEDDSGAPGADGQPDASTADSGTGGASTADSSPGEASTAGSGTGGSGTEEAGTQHTGGGADSGTEDATPPDSGSGTGEIVCGTSMCSGGTICCYDSNTPKCIQPTEPCAYGYGTTIACDGPEDCGDGELCMQKPGSYPLSVGCVVATDPYSAYCHNEIDCEGSSFAVRCCNFGVPWAGMNQCVMESLCPAP